MKEAEFRAWLESKNYAANTVNTQLAQARRLAGAYGSLDEQFDKDDFASLRTALAYSKEDARNGRPDPASFEIAGSLYDNLASYRATFSYYSRFRKDKEYPDDRIERQRRERPSKGLTRDAILLAMDECEALGLPAFLESYDYGTPSKYWVLRPDSAAQYPAKAIVGVAHGFMSGGVPLPKDSFYGGRGEQEANGTLERLGFKIVGRNEREVLFEASGSDAVHTGSSALHSGGPTIRSTVS